MPSRQEHSIAQFRGWEGGLNTDKNEILLEPDETPDCLNVDFDEGGAILKRKGFTKWTTSDPSNYGEYLFHYRQGSTDWLIIVEAGGNVMHVDSGTATTFTQSQIAGPINVTMGDEGVDATTFDGVFYLSSRDSTGGKTYTFDGTTWTQITDNTLNGSGTEFAHTKRIVNQHERIFGFDVDENAGEFPSRIWFSDPGLAQTWQSDSWIDVDPDDGTTIKDAASIGDKIVIFKNDSFYALSGVDDLSFTLFPISPSVGTGVRKTAQNVDGVLVWFNPNTGVWAFDGANFRHVDNKINSRILDGLNDFGSGFSLSTGAEFSSFAWKGRYYLMVPWTAGGGGTDNWPTRTFVWDLRNDRWTEYSYAFSHMVGVDNTVYATGLSTGPSPSTGVWTVFDADDDAGSAIAAHFETPWFAPKDGFIEQHRIRKIQVYATGESANPATLTVASYKDWDGSTIADSQTQSTSTTNDMVSPELSGYDQLGKAWKIRVSDNSTDPWQVNGIDVLFSSRPTSRGDLDS